MTADVQERAEGIYTLIRRKKVVAAARVGKGYMSENESHILVTAKNRKDAVKLYELIRDGKVRPDVEAEEFDQIEGALNELRRLRRKVKSLKDQLEKRDNTISSLQGQLTNVRTELAQAQLAAEIS